MGGQPANRLDVQVLAPGRQPRQGHVLRSFGVAMGSSSSPFVTGSAGSHRASPHEEIPSHPSNRRCHASLGEAVQSNKGCFAGFPYLRTCRLITRVPTLPRLSTIERLIR
jgi:hypothetical protein